MAHLTKRQKKIKGILGDKKLYSPSEAIELVKKTSLAKFDETVEVAFFLGINPKHADQQVRSTVTLPEGTGQAVRVVVVTKGEGIEAAKEAGAEEAGSEELLEKIQGGWFDFDVLIATQDMMGQVSRLGRVLGPRKLMPNPKAGTVVAPSPDIISSAVGEFKAGKVEFRNDKHGNVHVAIGKSSFEERRLLKNMAAIANAIQKIKPAAVKGQYIKTLAVSSTMGTGLRVDPTRLTELSSID